ncbi:MAG TPA: type II secretion system protein [Polyangiaceae bacterium]|nr:type II secretion system protein [Polyangiaceae bacterium]
MKTLQRSSERAFTLIELMTVVVIVGVLATLGLVAYRRFITSSKTSEAIYMVGAIRAAEESYRAETLMYLPVSAGFSEFYPTGSVGAKKTAWDNPTHSDYARWRELGARPDGPVYYGYKVTAGGAGATIPALDCQSPTWPTPTEPWYIVEAKGDVDGNSVFSWAAGSSFSGEIYVENEGE